MSWLTTLRVHVDALHDGIATVTSTADGTLTLCVPPVTRGDLAALVGRDVDMEMLRHPHVYFGTPCDGEAIEWWPVVDGDAVAAWDAWYEACGRPWDGVVDIERELGRDE